MPANAAAGRGSNRGLIALILAEKLLPRGHVLACASGLGLVAWGTALLFP
ncbi:MAG TPA: hypothetical protein VF793_12470 [Telluria sp.]